VSISLSGGDGQRKSFSSWESQVFKTRSWKFIGPFNARIYGKRKTPAKRVEYRTLLCPFVFYYIYKRLFVRSAVCYNSRKRLALAVKEQL
jgi:hypothetical protein